MQLELVTIFDKDIWIYAISKLQQSIFEYQNGNTNIKIDRTITFSVYDYLISTNRSTSKKAYDDFLCTLQRLKGKQH